MVLRLSKLFLRTLREDPADAEVASHRLLVRAGYIRRAAPGIYTWLPLGLSVLRKVETVIREEMSAIGAQEVHFPALLPKEPYEATNRWTEYGEGIFRLKDRKGNDYLLAPTHEEMFTLLVKDLYSSYKDLPLSIYQIQNKYRDEARPRAGLLRGREFIMKDSYSFDVDDAGLDASYEAHRGAYLKIFERLGLEVVPVSATAGAMGGSKSEEFLHPTEIGEDTFVRSAGGYAANVEAVTTVVPADIDFSNAPAAEVRDTPDTPTIETLVDAANVLVPRATPTAAPGLPPTRSRTSSSPSPCPPANARSSSSAFPATAAWTSSASKPTSVLPADRRRNHARGRQRGGPQEAPLIVKGYLGPGLSLDAPLLGTEGAAKLLYLVDPRVVSGSAWVTGANEAGKHVFGLVAGRDFGWDGVIECTDVRAGDEAPDGSGPLETARGIEMGHIFQLGRKYAEALELKVLDQNGKQVVVTMGSYGVGVTRAVAALAESNHDDKGLVWPRAVAPADVHVVAVGRGEEIFAAAEKLALELEAAGLDVIYDDRPKVSPGVKFGDAELVGVPTILAVGRGLVDGVVEIKDRRSGDAENIAVEKAVDYVVDAVRNH